MINNLLKGMVMAELNTLEDVLNEWHNNFAFQQAFKQNPEKALNDVGLALKPQDLEQIKSILKIDDDDLPPIINK